MEVEWLPQDSLESLVDIAEPLPTPVEYCEWVLVDRGQVGYRLPHTAPFFSRLGQ